MSARVAQVLLQTESVSVRPSEPFTFASGLRSPIYCDHRRLLSFPNERKIVIEELSTLGRKLGAEQIAGVATAGIPWGAWMAEVLNLPFAFVRSKPKDHGAGKQIEGVLDPKRRTLIVEDLISTAGSSLSAAQAVADAGIAVIGIASIFTYQFETAQQAAGAAGVALYSTTTLDELLAFAAQSGRLHPQESDEVRRWRTNPAGWEP